MADPGILRPTCSTCTRWQAEPDNGMGYCTGMIAEFRMVEIISDSEAPPQVFTHKDFGCILHLGVDKILT